jgi:hypothetical protein
LTTVVDDDDDAFVKLLPLKRTLRDEEETLRVDVLVVKRDDEENEESNARVADAILVRVCVRARASVLFCGFLRDIEKAP